MPVNIAINNDTCHLLSVVCPKNSSTKDLPKKTSIMSVPVRKVFSFSFPSFEKGHCWSLCTAMLLNRFLLPYLSCSVRQRRKVGAIICVYMSDKATGAPISMCIPEYHPRTDDELGGSHRGRLCAPPHALWQTRGALFDKSLLVFEELLPFCASVALVGSKHLSFVYWGTCGTKDYVSFQIIKYTLTPGSIPVNVTEYSPI